MKQLRTYEGFFDFFKKSDKSKVAKICKKYNIENWFFLGGNWVSAGRKSRWIY